MGYKDFTRGDKKKDGIFDGGLKFEEIKWNDENESYFLIDKT